MFPLLKKTHRHGIAIGLAATATVAGLHLGGVLRDFEDWAYDQRMRHFNMLAETDRIVHIDLTDQTLDLIGPWPWPRRMTGDLIRALAELGAETIALDIEFKRPTDPREVDGLRVDDDEDLAEAIAAAGNVFVPVSFKSLPPGVTLEAARQRARDILRSDPGISDAEFRRRLGAFDVFGESGLLRFRLGELLRVDFGLGPTALAERAGESVDRVNDVLAGVKLAVARERVNQELTSRPDLVLDKLVVALCGVSSPDQVNPEDRRVIERALEWVESTRAVLSHTQEARKQNLEVLPTAVDLEPPIAQVGNAALATGFVAFEGERNVVRNTALLVRYTDRIIPHLGLAVACRMAGIALDDIRVTPETELEMPNPAEPGQTLRIRLDDRGRALINWSAGAAHAGRKDGAWLGSFRHVPAARVMEIPLFRREVERNQLLLEQLKQYVVERFDPASAPSYAAALEELRRFRASPPTPETATRLGELVARVGEIESGVFEELAHWHEEIRDIEPHSDDERRDFELVRSAYADLVEGKFAERIRHLQAEYEDAVRERIAELRPRIEGMTCLIGYTASAVADMKPTPVYDIAPGVMIYSNIINQVLAGRMPRWAPGWTHLCVIALAGAIVTWVAATTSAVASIAMMLALALAYAALNAGLIYRIHDVFLAFVAPVLTMAAAWAAVTVYRQLTEERQRRRFSRALAQYVSPAVADRLSQQAEHLDLSPVAREVTCFFSDLKGFTTLSERLGAERTRAVLNPYLEAMSRTLHEHQAMINKFMGDGIFAFFNAPIFACPQHAERACAAALRCFEVLEELKADPPSGAPAAELAALSMRVGLSTGTVFVGDYGSATKLDYTAIGDSINLGARLEPANKEFGTRIAVAGRTRELAGNSFVFRRLGRILVLGKTEGVDVYELLGRSGQVVGVDLEYAERFERAVDAFSRREFASARSGFERCVSEKGHDLCARRYLRLVDELEVAPPSDDWPGTIELTSK